jgi:hypothetical protein
MGCRSTGHGAGFQVPLTGGEIARLATRVLSTGADGALAIMAVHLPAVQNVPFPRS